MLSLGKGQRGFGWKWIIIFGSALSSSIFAALIVSQLYSSNGQPISFVRGFAWQAPIFFLWAFFVPVIIWAGKKFRLSQGGWTAAFPTYIFISIPLILLHTIFTVWIMQAVKFSSLYTQLNFNDVFNKALILERIPIDILIYWAIVGVIYASEYYTQFKEREGEAKELESQLISAQLQALKMQLNPHFLFNTLQTINVLITKEPDTAKQMITKLGDLLRATLSRATSQEVTLGEEISLLQDYLAIEQIRFKNRLIVHYDVTPSVNNCMVPDFILQPLVENAITHGIAPKLGMVTLTIKACSADQQLIIEVIDNGIGLPSNWQEGIGLGATRARLQRLYGLNHRFQIIENEISGITVRIEIPIK